MWCKIAQDNNPFIIIVIFECIIYNVYKEVLNAAQSYLRRFAEMNGVFGRYSIRQWLLEAIERKRRIKDAPPRDTIRLIPEDVTCGVTISNSSESAMPKHNI